MAANTNVMSIAPQAGNGTRAAGSNGRSSVRAVGRSQMSAQKNGKFGEVLGQTGEKFSQKDVVEKIDEAMDLPKDPIAAVIAASSQQKQTETPKESVPAETEEAMEASDDVQPTVDGLPTASPITMQVQEVKETSFRQVAETDVVPTAKLQTLLPQSDETEQKSKAMLHMLSSQGWRQMDSRISGQIVANTTGQATPIESTDAQIAQTMRIVQDVQGVSNQQMPQLTMQEQSQPLQQVIQQERPQAQPGMQGMPVMQDAQASLTQPTQIVPDSQVQQMKQVMPDSQIPQMKQVMPSSQMPQAQQMPQENASPLDEQTLGKIPRGMEVAPEEVVLARSNSFGDVREMQQTGNLRAQLPQKSVAEAAQVIPEQAATSKDQDFAIPQDRFQPMAPMRETQQQREPVRQAAVAATPEEALTVTASSAAETQTKPREELSKLLGTQVRVEASEEQPIAPLRQMMHGQGQMDGRQEQNAERQQMAQQKMEELLPSDEIVERRNPAPANTAQAPVETTPQPQHAMGFQQVLSTAQASETAEAPMMARQDFDIPGQIVEQARLIRSSENTEMVIHLKPEHLGDLTLKVSVSSNGAVTASFHSDNAQVRAIIENSLVQLRQELSNQGIKVDNVEVYAGLSGDSLLNGQSQQAWQQNQQGNSSRNQNYDFDAYEEENAEFSAASDALSGVEEGVDYRV